MTDVSNVTEEIFDIDLPPIWTKTETQNKFGVPRGIWWYARLPERPEVEIGRWFLQKNRDSFTQTEIKNLFESGPREISPTAHEGLLFLRQGFPRGTDTEINSIRVDQVANEPCIIFETSWKGNGVNAIEVMIDSSRSGNCLNHFYYAARPELFDVHVQDFWNAFATLHVLR